MCKYRKKPVVIEAFQWLGYLETPDMPEWAKLYEDPNNTNNAIIKTLEGAMTAVPGDFIVQGVRGELYPCKPDIFEETYEKVVED